MYEELSPLKCQKKYAKWTQEDPKLCGPNHVVCSDKGFSFDDLYNIVIYYNEESNRYYLDQEISTDSIVELKEQLLSLMERLDEYEKLYIEY